MRSLRARLNLGILIGITLILALNGVLIYMVVRARLFKELDQSLATVAQSFASQISVELNPSKWQGSERADYVLSGVHLWAPGRSERNRNVEPIPAQDLWERIHQLRHDADSILIDGVNDGMDDACGIAHLLGLESVVLVPLEAIASRDEARIDRLITLANRGDVDVAVIGRKVLDRGVLTEEELGRYLRLVRSNVPKSVRLTTADSVEAYLDHPKLLSDIDFLFPIYDPFSRGTHIENAVPQISCWHQDLVASARGKAVVVAETGWPTSGESKGSAVPSSHNAARYFTDFVTWARLNEVRYYYASGIDGPHSDESWGYRTTSGSLKPGMQTVFDGLLPQESVPTILLTPPWKPRTLGLQGGIARHVPPFAHAVALYLRVGGMWWNKPSFADAMTPIGCDGSWQADITTGAGDEGADRVIAFLLPIHYIPPMLDGEDVIPQQIFEVALAVAEMDL
ncbi:MAG: hypothetical protein ACI841_003206 [Planctomycetota bacterium]